MKRRIFIIIILCFNILAISKVYAQTFYSELSDIELDSSKYQVEVIKKYRYYKEDVVGEYVLKDSDYKYTNIDNNNIKYGEYSEIKDLCDTNKDVKYITIYPYKKVKSIRYVKVYNRSKALNISNISVYSKDKKIGYKVINSDKYNDYIMDINGYVYIMLDTDIEYQDFNIIINSSEYSKIIHFNTYTSEEIELNNMTILVNGQDNRLPLDNFTSNFYTNMLYSSMPIQEDNVYIIYSSINKCIERDIYVYNYDIIRNYLDGYYLFYDGYIKDDTDYKTYYRYVLDSEYIDNINNKLNNINKNIISNNIDNELDSIISNINNFTKSNNNLYTMLNNLVSKVDLLSNDEDNYTYSKIEKLLSSNLDNDILNKIELLNNNISKCFDNELSSNSIISILKIDNIKWYIIIIILVIILIIYLICRKKSYK